MPVITGSGIYLGGEAARVWANNSKYCAVCGVRHISVSIVGSSAILCGSLPTLIFARTVLLWVFSADTLSSSGLTAHTSVLSADKLTGWNWSGD